MDSKIPKMWFDVVDDSDLKFPALRIININGNTYSHTLSKKSSSFKKGMITFQRVSKQLTFSKSVFRWIKSMFSENSEILSMIDNLATVWEVVSLKTLKKILNSWNRNIICRNLSKGLPSNNFNNWKITLFWTLFWTSRILLLSILTILDE